MRDYYYILGLNENASTQEIKVAYRKLSLKFHPDKNDGEKFFEERFKEIQIAYETLSNPTKRKDYDIKFKKYGSFTEANSSKNDEDLKRKYEEELKKKEEEIKKRYAERDEKIKNEAEKKSKNGGSKKNSKNKFIFYFSIIIVSLGAFGFWIFKIVSNNELVNSNNSKKVSKSEKGKLEQESKDNNKNSNERTYQIGLIGLYTNKDLNEDTILRKLNRNIVKADNYTLEKLSELFSQTGTDISPDGLSIIGCTGVKYNLLKKIINTNILIKRNYEVVGNENNLNLIYSPKYLKEIISKQFTIGNYKMLFVSGKYVGEKMFFLSNYLIDEKETNGNNQEIAKFCKAIVDSIYETNNDAKIILLGNLNYYNDGNRNILKLKNYKNDLISGDLFSPWVDSSESLVNFNQILLSSAWLKKNNSGFFYKESKIFNKSWLDQISTRYIAILKEVK